MESISARARIGCRVNPAAARFIAYAKEHIEEMK